ncbi:MAG TPA: aldehyde dehydrogenase family protein [Bacteroidetes bacterium]|nr:aldehyde dehydrogenase family protein [Bacteroidota bacterium]
MADIKSIFEAQQKKCDQLKRTSAKERLAKLNKIEKYISDQSNIDALQDALYKDFKKPASEVYLTELGVVHAQISHIKNNLSFWMLNKKVDTPLLLQGTSSYIKYEPKGVCLVLSPWNYPFNLAMVPVLYAISAGNAVILKPSEITTHASAYLNKMISELFECDEVCVIEGDVSTSTSLLELPFDHIFFTGSPQVGKIVMTAAAKNLTSVTLELGGKSPAIIDEKVDIRSAAEKLAWAKCLNNGQTCIAPDYAIVHESKKEALISELKACIGSYYDPENKGIQASQDYSRVVNNKHLNRIKTLIDDAVEKGAKLECGGEVNQEDNFLAPTILSNVNEDMSIMHEEIFGPVLPIMTFKNKEDVPAAINKRPKPLSMYIASKSHNNIQYYIDNTSSGGTIVNDYMLGYSNPNLPFGGVNNSGIGKSLGFHSFVEFSNERGILKRHYMKLKPFMYPPYTNFVKKIIKLIYKWM